MQPREYDIMYNLETTYWWHTGMMAIMEQILAPTFTSDCKLLDIGSGTGVKLQRFGKFCETWGIDYHPRAVELSLERGLKNVQQGDATRLPFPDETFSHAVCCEVLTCVEDDEAAVREAFRVLKPGGYYYVSDQANPILRSQHDVSQGALRRYTHKQLGAMLGDAGFDVKRITGANTILFPLLAAYRLASKLRHPPEKIKPEESRSDLKPLPGPINFILRSILETERALLGRIDLPFGLTVIALAQKPAQ